MPYFFGERTGSTVVISGRDALHLARSLRARVGQTVSVVEPGRLLSVRLTSVAAERVEGEVVSAVDRVVEPALSVTVGLSLLPAAALEEAFARCTELGAAGFVVFEAARSVARGRGRGKPERWASICREAAMLAGREVVPPVRMVDAIPDGLMLDARGGERLGSVKLVRAVTVLVGPEGGWTDEERAGRRLVSLGPRNLRAENAAAAAVAVALASAGDL